MFITPLNPHGDTPLDARRECYIPPLPTNSTMTTPPSNALKPSRAPFTNLFAIRVSLPRSPTLKPSPRGAGAF